MLLQLSTGGGKTFIFSTVLNGALKKGKRCVMAVKGRSLVDQASRRLTEMCVEHSVFMAGDKRFDQNKQIQICSIDTIRARKHAPPADIVVIDEAHNAVSKSYRDFLENYPDAFWLGVTATPWAKGGLKHLADKIIYPISMADLIKQGWLLPAKYFIPTDFDSSKIAVKNGEFDEKSAMVQFKEQSVYGDVIKSYRTKCVGEPTFCFAINVAHANLLQEHFTAAEIKSMVITAETTLVERSFLLESLTEKKIDIVISIGTMLVGVDYPPLKNILVCRPTKSKIVYVQMLGRGTRTYEGKDHFKVIDHVGNVARHGFLLDETKASLEPEIKRIKSKKEKTINIKTCPECFAVLRAHDRKCDQCGHLFVVKKLLPKEFDGDLIEIDAEDIGTRIKIRAKYHTYNAWGHGYKIGAVWFRLLEEFSIDDLRKYYQPYRKAKADWQRWLDGDASAPCTYGAARYERDEDY